MAIKNGLLSDLQLRHWTKEAQPLAKSDGGGLTFTVSANGCATWILRYRYGDHGTAGPAHASRPYSGNWQRQLQVQEQLRTATTTDHQEGKGDQELIHNGSVKFTNQVGQIEMEMVGYGCMEINTVAAVAERPCADSRPLLEAPWNM